MMKMRHLGPLLALTLATAGVAAAKNQAKPRLSLRANPRIAISPVQVLATAELVGGDESEDYYCPALEWDWGDGSKSVREADCPPFEEAGKIDRRFTASHGYGGSGEYTVTVTMRRADRRLAQASLLLNIRPGLGQ